MKMNSAKRNLIAIAIALAVMLLGALLPVLLLSAQRSLLTGRVQIHGDSSLDMVIPETQKPDATYIQIWMGTRNSAESMRGPRDPKPNEISMEKALQRGMDFIESWVEKGLLPASERPLSSYSINAIFYSAQSRQTFSEISYWEISFVPPMEEKEIQNQEYGQDMRNQILLQVDAATGAIFHLEHHLPGETYAAPFGKIIQAFTEQFELTGSPVKSYEHYESGHYAEYISKEDGIRIFIGTGEKAGNAGITVFFMM